MQWRPIQRNGAKSRRKGNVVERQEIPNEEVAIHSLKACRNGRTVCQEMTEAHLKCEETTSADMKACQEATACNEATEAALEKTEPDSGMMQSVGEHREVSKEDAIVKPVKGRKKRHRGRKLVAGKHGDPKELTREICGSRRKLAAACRNVSRRPGVTENGKVFRSKFIVTAPSSCKIKNLLGCSVTKVEKYWSTPFNLPFGTIILMFLSSYSAAIK
jgi:hypothetical protein